MDGLTLLFDFDGTLVNQHRKEAYRKLVEKYDCKQPKKLAAALYQRDVLLCSREMYDRACVFCKFKRFFPRVSTKRLCIDFWEAVEVTQRRMPGCVNTLEYLHDAGHNLYCATDTDGPGTNKLNRVSAPKLDLRRFFKDVFIGSEKGVPPKGEPGYLKYILETLRVSKKRCVMIGDKPKSDLLPARDVSISSILVVNPEYLAQWPVAVTRLQKLPAAIRGLTKGVFLSYSHLDEEFIKKLEKALSKQNVKVWLDNLDMRGGDPLVATVTEAIKSLPYFVVVISRNSAKSRWVRYEVEQALGAMLIRRKRRKKVVPIRIDNVRLENVHEGLVGRFVIDFRSGIKKGLPKLLASIETLDKLT